MKARTRTKPNKANKAKSSRSNRGSTNPESWDYFLYSGMVLPDYAEQFFAALMGRRERKENLSLILTTFGGDAHTAYRIARFIGSVYRQVRVIVMGPCKSAGTLIVLGAHEIAFGPFGEIGPLDVQITKKDEILFSTSGLDTLQTYGLMTGYAYATFEDYMLQTVTKSGGTISTKTACDVASQLTVGVLSPLMSQIDPHRLSEVQRMMAIAQAYGKRLQTKNIKPEALEKLVAGYPDHSFIIDREEAADLFHRVDDLSEVEFQGAMAAEKRTGCVMSPHDGIVVHDVWPMLLAEEEGDERENDDGTHGADSRGAQPTETRGPRDPEPPAAPTGRAKNPRQASTPEKRAGAEAGDEQVDKREAAG